MPVLTMSHIVDSSSLMQLDVGLSVDNDAVLVRWIRTKEK